VLVAGDDVLRAAGNSAFENAIVGGVIFDCFYVDRGSNELCVAKNVGFCLVNSEF
jgi:hypothetical protein